MLDFSFRHNELRCSFQRECIGGWFGLSLGSSSTKGFFQHDLPGWLSTGNRGVSVCLGSADSYICRRSAELGFAGEEASVVLDFTASPSILLKKVKKQWIEYWVGTMAVLQVGFSALPPRLERGPAVSSGGRFTRCGGLRGNSEGGYSSPC